MIGELAIFIFYFLVSLSVGNIFKIFIFLISEGCQRSKIWQGSCEEVLFNGECLVLPVMRDYLHTEQQLVQLFWYLFSSWSGEDIFQMNYLHQTPGLVHHLKDLPPTQVIIWVMTMSSTWIQGNAELNFFYIIFNAVIWCLFSFRVLNMFFIFWKKRIEITAMEWN